MQTRKKANKSDKKNNITKNIYPLKYKIILGFIILLTFIVFSNTLKNGFIVNWDDDGYILNNAAVQQLNNKNIKEIFTTFYMGNYHPLTTISYATEFHFFKQNPKAYHFMNLLLHLCNVVLVFFFVKLLTKKNLTPLMVGALFAIHPLHVESVAWISERKDVLYSFFFLLSLIFYMRFSENGKLQNYVLAFLFFLLSLLSKSAAVILPLILLLIDYYKNIKINVRGILLKLPFFILAVVFGIIALKSQDAQQQHLTPDYTLINSFFVATYGLSFYIFKFFVPVLLSAFYPHPVLEGEILPLIYYLSPLLIILFVFIVFRMVKEKKVLVFGFLFFFFSLALVLQFFPVGGAVVAERYTYMAYVGLAFIVGVFLENLFDKQINNQTFILSVFTTIVLIFSVLTYNRNKVWADGISLFDDVIKKHPNAFYAYHSRGIAYYYAGNYKQSLKDYDKATELNNTYGLTFYNKGLAQMMLKQYADALLSFSRTIELIPTHDQAYNDRAIVYYNQNQLDAALKDYNKAIELNPLNARAYYNRGALYYRLTEMTNACTDWQKAQSLGLNNADDLIKKYCTDKD